MLSNTCKYAIRAVIYLGFQANDDKKIGIKQISKELDIPTPFLGKILQSLAKSKLLSSTKGPHGGFGLGRDAYEISLLNIVEIIDGLDVFENCLIGTSPCKKNEDDGINPCPVHGKFSKIRTEMYEMFKNETVGKIVEDMGSAESYISL